MIAGVCAALARRFGMKPSLVRLIFVISCLLPGPQFLIYIVLWVLMPAASPNADTPVERGVERLRTALQQPFGGRDQTP